MADNSLFNASSLADYAQELTGEFDPNKKKKSQLTGTMYLGGQTGTFNGDLDLEDLKQSLQNGTVGYQMPSNISGRQDMQMPQQPVAPTLPAPAPPPPVGASPISGEFQPPPMQQPIQMPPGNQPYQPTPPNDYDFGGQIDPVTGLPPGVVLNQPYERGYVAPEEPMQPIDPSFAKISGGPYQPTPPEEFGIGNFSGIEISSDSGYIDENGNYIPHAPLGYLDAGGVMRDMPPPQMQQPVDRPGDIYGGLTPGQALGGEYTMQQPVDRPQDMYNQYQSQLFDPQSTPQLTDEQNQEYQGEPIYAQPKISGPIEPDWKYNSDNTMRSIRGMGPDNTPYRQSQQYDPITGKWGMPGGTGGQFMEGISIGY
jgi:hypothetical protein